MKIGKRMKGLGMLLFGHDSNFSLGVYSAPLHHEKNGRSHFFRYNPCMDEDTDDLTPLSQTLGPSQSLDVLQETITLFVLFVRQTLSVQHVF